MEEIDSKIFLDLFKQYNLKPDLLEVLQSNAGVFNYQNWVNVVENIPKTILNHKFIYFIFKVSGSMISAIYIGKSERATNRRLKQHIEGLKSAASQANIPSSDPFYERLYDKLFNDDSDSNILMAIFDWKDDKIIKNVFPFDLAVNVSNAEAVLISEFSQKFRDAIINHAFVSRTKWAKKNLPLKKVNQTQIINISGEDSKSFWDSWCENWFLTEQLIPTKNDTASNYQHVSLLKINEDMQYVETFKKKTGKTILTRSPEMEMRVMDAVKVVKRSYEYHNALAKGLTLDDQGTRLFTDGLIYCIYVLKTDVQKHIDYKETKFESEYIPIYIGKTEALGRNGGYSANLKRVDQGKNKSYFARWGNDDARHIGGLSLRFFNVPNNYPSTDYEPWIEKIFDSQLRKKEIPRLKIPVYFQMKPWFPFNISLAGKMGIFTPELETILIALGRNMFPQFLSNKQNR